MVIAQYYLEGTAWKYDQSLKRKVRKYAESLKRNVRKYDGSLPPIPSRLQALSYTIREVHDKLVTIKLEDALTPGSALDLYPSLSQCHAVSYNVFLSPESFS